MKKYITSKEGVLCMFDENYKLSAVIFKDKNTHQNIFHSCKEMNMDELEQMVGADTVQTNPK